MTPEDFITGKERSYLRNPLIAEAFYRTGDIEIWGSGLKRIFDECHEFGVKVTFQILKTGFLTTFYRPEAKKRVVEKGRERIKKDLKLGEKLGETEINILELISKDRKVSIVLLSEKLKLSTTAIEKNIANLKRKGILKRVGPAKGGYWEIIEE